ncbi:MAG TPA: QueT transporter family protein [Bacteroidetes bacterium]|nr:QueT transporter family protein [Bacteroidota bacterium]
MKTIKQITFIGVFAALYSALTIFLAPISYSNIQVRVAEALTVLPYLTPLAIPALFIGVLLANLFGGFGPWDIFGGSFLTLIAAILTYLLRKTRKPWLAPLPPVLINAFGVSAYLQFMIQGFEPGLKTYFFFVSTIGLGELIACYVLGYPLLRYLMKSEVISKYFHQN